MGRVSRSRIAPYAAHLRVYEPREVVRAAGLVAETARVGRRARRAHDSRVDESRRSLASAAATPPVVVPDRESLEAHELVVDGRTYLCPWQIRLRSWQALDALRRQLPDPVVEMLLTPAVATRLEADGERLRLEQSEQVAHIRTATWHVPAPWFVYFDPADRQVEPVPRSRSLVYRTPISSARRRGALALRTLRRALGGSSVADDVEHLSRWLEEFHPRSVLELDYGGLVLLMTDEQLAEDNSVAEVADALDRLAEGDAEGALGGYERLMTRWRDVQLLEHAN